MLTSDEELHEILSVALSDGDGMVAFQRLYADESGTHEGSPVTCVGMFMARPTEWKKWTKDWVRQKKPINVFHAVDCQNLRREFKGWNKQERDEYVAKLLPVIAKHQLKGNVVGFQNEALDRMRLIFPKMDRVLESTYEVCFLMALTLFLDQMKRLGIHDRIAVVHEDNDFKSEALAAFDWLKRHSEHKDRKMSLTFASKGEAVPLQAADILAYEGNKRIRNPDKKERRAWRALNPDRSHVGLHYYDQGAIEQWLIGLERMGVELR